MICPKCGWSEGSHVQKLTDEEYFMEIWTPTLGLEEAQKSWQEKQNQPKQLTHMVMPDIGGYVSMVDGTWIKSRSHHRSHLKQHGMIELGNDVPTAHKPADMSTKSKEARKQQIAELAYAKLQYK
jgi:hypothetical protein